MALFTKAQKSASKLRMALAGPAGSGKTWTALAIATGLGERIALVDTERGGGNYYADQFDFDSLELTSFHPDQYIKALAAAIEEGYQVVIIDSLSHAWFGRDGALELVDRAAKRSQSGNSFMAWREVTPLHNKLVDAMLKAPVHVVVTLRSKTEYILETDTRGKQVPKKVGMAPVQRDGLEYEFDVFGELDHQHTLLITKSRVYGLADTVIEQPDQSFGHRIHALLLSGVSTPPPTSHKPRPLDASEFAYRMEAIWQGGGLDQAAITKRWAMLRKRCGEPIPERWYQGLLDEQRGWVEKHKAANESQEETHNERRQGKSENSRTKTTPSTSAQGLHEHGDPDAPTEHIDLETGECFDPKTSAAVNRALAAQDAREEGQK